MELTTGQLRRMVTANRLLAVTHPITAMTPKIGQPLRHRQESKFQAQLILESLEKTVILQLDLQHRVFYY